MFLVFSCFLIFMQIYSVLSLFRFSAAEVKLLELTDGSVATPRRGRCLLGFIYIYIYICMYVRICMYVCVYIYIYMYTSYSILLYSIMLCSFLLYSILFHPQAWPLARYY